MMEFFAKGTGAQSLAEGTMWQLFVERASQLAVVVMAYPSVGQHCCPRDTKLRAYSCRLSPSVVLKWQLQGPKQMAVGFAAG